MGTTSSVQSTSGSLYAVSPESVVARTVTFMKKPSFPDYKHEVAATRLVKHGKELDTDFDVLFTDFPEFVHFKARPKAQEKRAPRYNPQTMLDKRGGEAADLADEMKTEALYVEQVRDLSIGISQGEKAMMEHAFERGAKITVDDVDVQTSSLIGKGGQGAVLNAKYLDLGNMAYKTAIGNVSGNAVFRPGNKALRQEMNVAKEMGDHKNILALRGSQDDEQNTAMMTRLVGHGDIEGLFKRIQKDEAKSNKKDSAKSEKKDDPPILSNEDKMLILKHLMIGGFTGLQHMHSKGYAHRDVKEDNFLLDDKFEPKLMDFGLSRKLGTKNDAQEGTGSHVAPEQWSDEKQLTGKADVWSMGEMLLKGALGKYSYDIAKDRKSGKKIDGPKGALENDQWILKIKASPLFKDFISTIMRYDPEERADVKTALEHKFLQDVDRDKARGLIEKLFKK